MEGSSRCDGEGGRLRNINLRLIGFDDCARGLKKDPGFQLDCWWIDGYYQLRKFRSTGQGRVEKVSLGSTGAEYTRHGQSSRLYPQERPCWKTELNVFGIWIVAGAK